LLSAIVAGAAVAGETPAPSKPDPAGAGVSIEPRPAAATPRRQRAVFVCQEAGIPVYSDLPCGPVAVARTLSVEIPRAGAPPSTVPAAPRNSTRPRPSPAADDAPGRAEESRCATLQRQLAELDDRMRTGYSAREAARLWKRWRDLKEKLRTTRC
jgi:hypothetical protein